MGVLTNGYRDNIGVFRTYGATIHNNAYPYIARANYDRTGMKRNLTAGEGITDDKVGVPLGYGMKGWIMPQKAGMISARTEGINLDTTASILAGKALEGSVTLTITTNTPDGQLVSTVQIGGAPASLSITTNTPLMTASSNGDGSASFSITFANATLGAEASVIGDAVITINGTLTPYAIGIMEGTTEDQGLTVAGITNSIWNAMLTNYGTTGSAGNTLSLAGSGGVDYATLAAAVLAAAQVTPIHADVRKVNSYTVDGDGKTGTEWGPV